MWSLGGSAWLYMKAAFCDVIYATNIVPPAFCTTPEYHDCIAILNAKFIKHLIHAQAHQFEELVDQRFWEDIEIWHLVLQRHWCKKQPHLEPEIIDLKTEKYVSKDYRTI